MLARGLRNFGGMGRKVLTKSVNRQFRGAAEVIVLEWWPGPESNQRHAEFSAALSTELPGVSGMKVQLNSLP